MPSTSCDSPCGMGWVGGWVSQTMPSLPSPLRVRRKAKKIRFPEVYRWLLKQEEMGRMGKMKGIMGKQELVFMGKQGKTRGV